MPECNNCGAFVTVDYVRVFSPEDLKNPRVCPSCPDMVRADGSVREARAVRF